MRVIDRWVSNSGRAGRMTVDELPSDVKSGDVLVEPFPGLVFLEPPPEAEFFARLFAADKSNDWPDELGDKS